MSKPYNHPGITDEDDPRSELVKRIRHMQGKIDAALLIISIEEPRLNEQREKIARCQADIERTKAILDKLTKPTLVRVT